MARAAAAQDTRPDAAPRSAPVWHHDLADAVAAAKANGRELLFLFTGSDWCAPCRQLHDGVLVQPEFLDGVRPHFELVELDYPKHTPLPAPIAAQNEALKRRYEPGGYPTVMLLGTDELPYATIGGYRGESVADYLEKIRSARAAGVELRTELLAARELGGTERAAALDNYLRAVPSHLLRAHAALIDEARTLDPELPDLRARIIDAGQRGASDRQGTVVEASIDGFAYDASAEIHEALRILNMHHGGGMQVPAADSAEYRQAVFELLAARFKMGSWPRGALGNRALIAVANWADHQRDVALFGRCVAELPSTRQGLGGNEAFLDWFERRHRALAAGTAVGDFLTEFRNRNQTPSDATRK